MTSIELPEPVPLPDPNVAHFFKPEIVSREFLEIPQHPPSLDFWDVVKNRQSRRQYEKLDRECLSQLLWHAVKSRKTILRSSHIRWQSRPYPSAGGVHPIEILVVEKVAGTTKCAWYNATSHSLDCPRLASSCQAELLFDMANDVLPVQDGTILWFVANYTLVRSSYANPESLVWRDSGALLATIYLVAEALGLACCALGATGTSCVREALLVPSEFVGVGGCLVGCRAE